MNRSVLLIALLAVTPAFAQAPIATQPAAAPAQAEPAEAVATLDQPTESQIEAAEWGRRVLARANGQLPPSTDVEDDPRAGTAKGGCVRNPDRTPHGTAGVSVGTGGYRQADIFVTKPIGDCGQISVGISKSEGGYRGRVGPYR